MANRAATLDPNVFSISDLEALGGKRLPKMYRGECYHPIGTLFVCLGLTDSSQEYYNEGAMDMVS